MKLQLIAAACVLALFCGGNDVGYKRGPMWGSSTPANVSIAKQLARVELDQPADFTIYLYGWQSADGTNNTAGFYNVTIGSGGTAFKLDRVTVPARGRVLHFVSKSIQVDADPPGFAIPAGSVAKAHVGIGRPNDLILQNAVACGGGGTSAIVTLPPFVTEARIVDAFGTGAVPLPAIPADVRIEVAQANDPTFAFAIVYLRSALTDGVIPIDQSSGFWRVVCPTGGALLNYQHKTTQ